MALSLPIEVRCTGFDPQQVYTGDISEGGAFLKCDPETSPPIGSELEVQALKPEGDGEPAPVVHARVVRSTTEGIGIEFVV
jgi:hypothetical protein